MQGAQDGQDVREDPVRAIEYGLEFITEGDGVRGRQVGAIPVECAQFGVQSCLDLAPVGQLSRADDIGNHHQTVHGASSD